MKEGAYCTMIDYSTLNSNLKRGNLSKISYLNDRNKYYGYFIGHNEKCYCQYSFIHFSNIPNFYIQNEQTTQMRSPDFYTKKAAFYCRPLYQDLIRHFMTLAHIFS